MLKNIFLSLLFCAGFIQMPLTALAHPMPLQSVNHLAGQEIQLPFSLNFSPDGSLFSTAFAVFGKQAKALSMTGGCQVTLQEPVKADSTLSPRTLKIESVKFWKHNKSGIYSIQLNDAVVDSISCFDNLSDMYSLTENEGTVGKLNEILKTAGLAIQFVEPKSL